MKHVWLAMALFTLGASAETVVVKVPGMVCQMCVQGMRKSFKDYVNDSEKDVLVDLNTKLVTLNLAKPITDEQINKGVKDAGYNVESIVRKP